MPQMKPIYWMNLFIYFSISIFIFMIMNFYNILFLPNNIFLLKNMYKFFFWKW